METLSLNGRWQFKQTTETEWLTATVPGCVHTDLLAHGAIADPYDGDNELQLGWIGETDWQYQRTFTVTEALLQHTRVLLRCEGLDTLATIWLNDTEIGRTDNAFRSWEFDVKALLQMGENEIVVRTVTVACQVTAERLADTPLQAHCQISLDGQEVGSQVMTLVGDTAVTHFTINKPQLWWPNGLGEQSLYTVTVTLLDESGQALDSWQKRIGLRTLRLIREADEWGESFHFACNGVPFFAKGANWIPADTFLTSVTGEDYGRLVQAAAVHMNMLRVWGGGIYEQPAFYDWCDELGICVWQDFMFACATYPTYEETFVANVEQEARQNLYYKNNIAVYSLYDTYQPQLRKASAGG